MRIGDAMRRCSQAGPAALLLLLLAACGGGDPGPARPTALADRLPHGEQCLAQLAARGVAFRRLEPVSTARGCRIDTPVEVTSSIARFERPAAMSCALALAFHGYEREAQMAALERFGQPIATIHHAGAYACRDMTGQAGRLSEHAMGRAFDVLGFELADGTMLSVESDWGGRDEQAKLLRDLGQAGCRAFAIVLGPSHNAAHRDHFHFDIGPWSLCDP